MLNWNTLHSLIKTTALLILAVALLLITTSCRNTEQPGRSEPEKSEHTVITIEETEPDEQHTATQETVTVPRVGLYSGAGSWDVNVAAFENFFRQYEVDYALFDEEDALSPDLSDQFTVILFPGGFAAEYKYYITDHSSILKFIEEGGYFVGICAGAYYAADILRWQDNDYEYPLGLFAGRGIGPLSGLVAWGETTGFLMNHDHPANNDFKETLEFYYFDGPYFKPHDDSTQFEVLARYAVNSEPAVIAGRFGDGQYLLLGPHPELGGYSAASPDFNTEGGEGANWPWLYSLLLWFTNQ